MEKSIACKMCADYNPRFKPWVISEVRTPNRFQQFKTPYGLLQEEIEIAENGEIH